MRQYATLPIERLVSDVAVDPAHVRELADSIKAVGPIAPVLVREDTNELIDGFHRVAAMGELGFSEVDCILTPCDDDEAFWDMRIIQASLHRAVTFARAVDWIEEMFRVSPFQDRYKSAYSIFHSVRDAYAPPEVHQWVEEKAQKWGLAPRTIENWLYTKQTLTPEIVAEVRSPAGAGESLSPKHYESLARNLPQKPDLQGPVLEKARRESLTADQLGAVAKAVRQAADEREVQTILREPVSRTAEELTRAAKVETILRQPTVEPPPRERQYALTGLALEVYLDLQQQVHNIRRLTPDILASLGPHEQADLRNAAEVLIDELRRLLNSLGTVIDVKALPRG